MKRKVFSTVMAVIFVMLLGYAAIAMAGEIPLPENINIVAPSSDLPKELAAFSGKWEGNWDGVLDAILIVEEIGLERAKVIYAWGDAPEWNTKKAFRRYTAKVISGEKPKLEFGGGGPKFTVEMRKGLITIEVVREWRDRTDATRLKKVLK